MDARARMDAWRGGPPSDEHPQSAHVTGGGSAAVGTMHLGLHVGAAAPQYDGVHASAQHDALLVMGADGTLRMSSGAREPAPGTVPSMLGGTPMHGANMLTSAASGGAPLSASVAQLFAPRPQGMAGVMPGRLPPGLSTGSLTSAPATAQASAVSRGAMHEPSTMSAVLHEAASALSAVPTAPLAQALAQTAITAGVNDLEVMDVAEVVRVMREYLRKRDDWAATLAPLRVPKPVYDLSELRKLEKELVSARRIGADVNPAPPGFKAHTFVERRPQPQHPHAAPSEDGARHRDTYKRAEFTSHTGGTYGGSYNAPEWDMPEMPSADAPRPIGMDAELLPGGADDLFAPLEGDDAQAPESVPEVPLPSFFTSTPGWSSESGSRAAAALEAERQRRHARWAPPPTATVAERAPAPVSESTPAPAPVEQVQSTAPVADVVAGAHAFSTSESSVTAVPNLSGFFMSPLPLGRGLSAMEPLWGESPAPAPAPASVPAPAPAPAPVLPLGMSAVPIAPAAKPDVLARATAAPLGTNLLSGWPTSTHSPAPVHSAVVAPVTPATPFLPGLAAPVSTSMAVLVAAPPATWTAGPPAPAQVQLDWSAQRATVPAVPATAPAVALPSHTTGTAAGGREPPPGTTMTPAVAALFAAAAAPRTGAADKNALQAFVAGSPAGGRVSGAAPVSAHPSPAGNPLTPVDARVAPSGAATRWPDGPVAASPQGAPTSAPAPAPAPKLAPSVARLFTPSAVVRKSPTTDGSASKK